MAATPEEKAKRKEQVTAIQSILDSLDDVSEKLRALSRKIHAHGVPEPPARWTLQGMYFFRPKKSRQNWSEKRWCENTVLM